MTRPVHARQRLRYVWPAASLLVVGSVAFGIGQSMGTAWRFEAPEYGTERAAEVALVAAFIGSATCRFSQTPQVVADWRTAVDSLQRRAAERHTGFHTIGLGIAPNVKSGLDLLSLFGGFSEVNVGDWRSLGAQWYVTGNHRGSDATPQIVVLERRLSPGGLGVIREETILRIPGAEAIGRWIDAGAPLPPMSARSHPDFDQPR